MEPNIWIHTPILLSFAEAARDGVEDAARAVAERFKREPEDA
jgi:hypothetical protein